MAAHSLCGLYPQAREQYWITFKCSYQIWGMYKDHSLVGTLLVVGSHGTALTYQTRF